MNVQMTVRRDAADPKHGMTLDELAGFVQQAMRSGVPGATTVRIVSTWRSSIKRAEVTGATACDGCGAKTTECVCPKAEP